MNFEEKSVRFNELCLVQWHLSNWRFNFWVELFLCYAFRIVKFVDSTGNSIVYEPNINELPQ